MNIKKKQIKTKKRRLTTTDVLAVLELAGNCSFEYLSYLLTTLPAVFSRGSMMRGVREIEKQQERLHSNLAAYQQIYRLKKQGLIGQLPSQGLAITKSGRKYISDHPSWVKTYKLIRNKRQDCFVLIMFDIPESLRAKRDWLRYKLKEMRFKYLQLSVWFSDNFLLPQDFINDLKRYGIERHVKIFFVDRLADPTKTA